MIICGAFELFGALCGLGLLEERMAPHPRQANLQSDVGGNSQIHPDSDVEANLTLWSIRPRVGGRPIQTGDHKMIIVPEEKFPVQFSIMDLH